MTAKFTREEGFTLIEVLVAFAILSLSLATLYTMMTGTVARLERAEGKQYALALAEAKLGEISVTRPLRLGVQNGTFGDDYIWQLSITRLDNERVQNSGLALVSIKLSVQSPLSRTTAVTLETQRLVSLDEL